MCVMLDEDFIAIKRLFCLLICLLLVASASFAYQLSPLSVTYDPKGAGSAKVYTITNDSDSPIAVQVTALRRGIDIDGNEVTSDAGAYFSIQPAKMIIKPQSSQLVRVQYRGPQTVTKEMSFRIVSEQIPYSLGASEADKGQMISFLFVYSTSAYVAPTRVVESVSSKAYLNGEGKLEVMIENTGSVHQMLNSLSVTVTGDDGGSYTMGEEEMGVVNGANLLTDSKLRIVIDLPEELASSRTFDCIVRYDYKYSR